jgi:hypothetical protein
MTDTTREILNRVATGELSPEQAATLLAGISGSPTGSAAGSPGEASGSAPTAEAAPQPVRRVAVRSRAMRLVVRADSSVDTAVAEGPHRISHVGDTLTVNSDLSVGDYETEAPKSAFATWLSTMNRAGETLTVRVNPDLPVEILCVAGSAEVTGLRAGASIGVEAGSAKLLDGAGRLTLSVASGSADVEWRFSGESSVATDLGSSRVSVLPGSDVSITAEATLGASTIRLANGTTIKASPKSEEINPPVVVGEGNGRLRVSSRLGSSVVSVV